MFCRLLYRLNRVRSLTVRSRRASRISRSTAGAQLSSLACGSHQDVRPHPRLARRRASAHEPVLAQAAARDPRAAQHGAQRARAGRGRAHWVGYSVVHLGHRAADAVTPSPHVEQLGAGECAAAVALLLAARAGLPRCARGTGRLRCRGAASRSESACSPPSAMQGRRARRLHCSTPVGLHGRRDAGSVANACDPGFSILPRSLHRPVLVGSTCAFRPIPAPQPAMSAGTVRGSSSDLRDRAPSRTARLPYEHPPR